MSPEEQLEAALAEVERLRSLGRKGCQTRLKRRADQVSSGPALMAPQEGVWPYVGETSPY